MNVCTCPGPEQLRNYADGRLDPFQHEVIDAHLESCPDCSGWVEVLDEQGHTPFPHLRPLPSATAPAEGAEFWRLVASVKELSPGENSATTCFEAVLAQALAARGYDLLGPVGAGGMGRVYKAEHLRMKRTVAVKVLSPELLRSPAARARFAREVEAIARLTSPHIVAAFDAGEADGQDFLVMEYVEGRNLSEVVKQQGPLPIGRALTAVLHAARGLEQAHAAGIVHRDVKPANLLLDQRDTVKLLDLGLARLADECTESPDVTASGAVMGTAAFMAPEQASQGGRVDGRADVYSLGCTLFYLLTGRPPYEAATVLDTLLAHRSHPIPSLSAARPECPARVADLFLRMLAKRPEDRPALTAVIADLERCLLPRVPVRPNRALRWVGAVAAIVALCGALLWAALPPLGEAPAPPDNREKASKPGPAPTGLSSPSLAVRAPAPRKEATPVIEMVRIPSGAFSRGSPDSDKDKGADEVPRASIKIRRPFHLGKYEITQAQYQEVMGKKPSAFGPNYRFKGRKIDTRNHPVDSVSWLDAILFCNKLSERHGLPPHYRIDGKTVTIAKGAGYRLPTEAEWEHACRAETETRWYFGDDEKALGEHAWYAANAGGTTHAVGQKKANPWGLHDMYGNVPEWCWDRYQRTAYSDPILEDPSGPGLGEKRVYRGGGWSYAAAGTRSASRLALGFAYSGGGGSSIVGIRVARDIEP